MNTRMLAVVAAVMCALVFVEHASAQGFGPQPTANQPNPPPPCTNDCKCHLSSAVLSKCWNATTQKQCNGERTKCQTVLKAATGSGSCEINGTETGNKTAAGAITCTTQGCNIGTCPHNAPTPFVGPCNDPKTMCQNGGNCRLDNKGAAVCQCPTGFSGAQCQTTGNPNDKCKTNPCIGGVKCFNTAGSPGYTCQCPANAFGTNCDITPCSPNPCNAGTCSAPNGKAQCKCPTGAGAKVGPTCNTAAGSQSTCKTKTASTDWEVKCVQAGGKCIDYSFTKSRCQCPAGKHGTMCEKTGQAPNNCNSASVLQCVMQTRNFDPSTEAGQCDSYTTYAECAADAGCTNVMKVWCYMFFVQHKTCKVLTDPKYCAKPNVDSCDITAYESCYAQVDINAVDAPNLLANCAAAADCQQLRYSFCQRGTRVGANPNCANVPQEDVDFSGTENLPHASMLWPKEHKSSAKMLPLAASLVAFAAVGVAVFVVRRRQSVAANAEPLLEEEEMQA